MHTSNIRAFPIPLRARKRTTGTAAVVDIAEAYDHVGDAYGRYADGDNDEDPSLSSVRSAHADSVVWTSICTIIDKLQASGAPTLRLLDAGCGPGTWTRRIATYALRRGLKIDAVGFDISAGQLAIARQQAARFLTSVSVDQRPRIEFIEHSLTRPLPWDDGEFHLVLCNFAVLNHLTSDALERTVSELCRVSSHRIVSTIRALASPPTASIAGLDQVQQIRRDGDAGELDVLLRDGSRHRFTFNFYSAERLKVAFAPYAEVIDIRAIDLFVNRFMADSNWTADLVRSLPGRGDVLEKLREIEESLCRMPGWIDHGTHVLVVAEPHT